MKQVSSTHWNCLLTRTSSKTHKHMTKSHSGNWRTVCAFLVHKTLTDACNHIMSHISIRNASLHESMKRQRLIGVHVRWSCAAWAIYSSAQRSSAVKAVQKFTSFLHSSYVIETRFAILQHTHTHNYINKLKLQRKARVRLRKTLDSHAVASKQSVCVVTMSLD